MKKVILLLLLAICVLFTLSSVCAADVNDTAIASDNTDQVIEETNIDDNLTIGEDEAIAQTDNEILSTKDDGSFTALQDKIRKTPSGTTIVLENDYKYNEGFSTKGIDITYAGVIDGKGHTIDGMGKSRIFYYSSDYNNCFKVTLKNIVFCNALGGNGGAILAESDNVNDYPLTINNCKFIGNKATGSGGAVYVSSNANPGMKGVIMSGCTFTNNIAGKLGGAVYCEACEVNNCIFNSNRASIGGAIYDSSSSWEIVGSKFTGNVASKSGGAIYANQYIREGIKYSTKIIKCTFTANKAPKNRDIDGGIISNCVFNYLKLTLKKVNVKKSAKKLILQATLKKGKSPLKSKKITFKFNGKTYKAKTNSKGIAKITIKKKVLKKLKVGKKIKYQASYGKITVKKTAKVKK